MLFEKYGSEITIEQLADVHPSLYTMLDVRDEISHNYGCIPNSYSMPDIINKAEEGTLDKDKSYVLYCMHGRQSKTMADALYDMGYDAVGIKGGYSKWLMSSYKEKDEEKQNSVEKSLTDAYYEKLLVPFGEAVDKYRLINPDDHIAVCISGGKDSMLMAKLFQEYQKVSTTDFKLTFLVMDPGYSEINRLVIEKNARMMGIPVTIFKTDIFDAVYEVDKSPCYLCARMRRGHLYSKAKELGCNKISLGHHYDDVIETILMGMIYGGQIQTMMPKIKSTSFEGMELIRPMYLIREDDIMKWRDDNELHFIQCACHFTDTCSSCRDDGTSVSKRMEVKQLIAALKKDNPQVEANIFKSVENVDLNSVIAYKESGVKHSFTEYYS